MRRLLCEALVVSLLASPAFAAVGSVTEMSGTVLINTGHGFVPARADAALPPGASVMVRSGGRAILAFNDGCRVAVRPGIVVVVTKLSPCKRQGKPIALPMGTLPGATVTAAAAPVIDATVLGLPIQGVIIGAAAAAAIATTAAVAATEGASSP